MTSRLRICPMMVNRATGDQRSIVRPAAPPWPYRGGSVYPSSVHKIATALGVEPSELVKAS